MLLLSSLDKEIEEARVKLLMNKNCL